MGEDNRNPVIFRKQHFSTCPRPRFSLLQTFRSEVQDLDRSTKSMAQPAGIWWLTLNSVQYYLYWAIQQDLAAMSYDIKSYVLATAFKQSSSFEISININGFQTVLGLCLDLSSFETFSLMNLLQVWVSLGLLVNLDDSD